MSGGDSLEQQGVLGMPWAAFPSCCPTLTAGEKHQILLLCYRYMPPTHTHTHNGIYFANLVSLSLSVFLSKCAGNAKNTVHMII